MISLRVELLSYNEIRLKIIRYRIYILYQKSIEVKYFFAMNLFHGNLLIHLWPMMKIKSNIFYPGHNCRTFKELNNICIYHFEMFLENRICVYEA